VHFGLTHTNIARDPASTIDKVVDPPYLVGQARRRKSASAKATGSFGSRAPLRVRFVARFSTSGTGPWAAIHALGRTTSGMTGPTVTPGVARCRTCVTKSPKPTSEDLRHQLARKAARTSAAQ